MRSLDLQNVKSAFPFDASLRVVQTLVLRCFNNVSRANLRSRTIFHPGDLLIRLKKL